MKEQLLSQFDLHHRLYNNALDGFSDAEADRRIEGAPLMNHVKYLAGHLLNAQYGIAALGGVFGEVKWDDLFAAAGGSVAKDNFPYPPLEEIKAEWNRLHPAARKGLEALDGEALNTKPSAPMDGIIPGSPLESAFDNSIGGLWAFLNHHQAYHIGQIAILRRAFGKTPMSYS